MSRFSVVVIASASLLSTAALAGDIPTYKMEDLASSGFLKAGAVGEECAGKPATLRFNKVKEGGSFAGLRRAAADHAAWVHGKGYADVDFKIFTAFVGEDDMDAGDPQIAVGTLITYPSWARMQEILGNRTKDKDEAFDAFVAEYNENTEGFSSIYLCLQDS